MLRIVPSNKGGRILVDKEGYRYHINHHSKDKTRTFWRCGVVGRGLCKGTLTTNYYISDRIQILTTGPKHSHEPQQKYFKKRKIVEKPPSTAVNEPSSTQPKPPSPVETLPDAN